MPIGSMYAIYGNIYHQYTPFMLAYIPYTDPSWDVNFPILRQGRWTEWSDPVDPNWLNPFPRISFFFCFAHGGEFHFGGFDYWNLPMGCRSVQ